MAFEVEFQRGHGGAYLYVPKTGKPCPGIVVLHGSDGGRAGWSQWQALLFATQGFCALAPNYSKGGNGWHSGDILNVDLDDTEEALIWLRNHEATTGKVGLFGSSRGGEHALLATGLMVEFESMGVPDAVAVHSPSDTIVGAFIARNFDPDNRGIWDPALRAWRWRGSSENLLPTSPIPIECYSGPVMLTHGEADTVWTVECTRRLEERLIANGRKPEVYYYAGQDHQFSPEAHNLQHNRLTAFFQRHLQA
ncbi:MAG: acyl-CoA thioester hydrolase/BAAT C-terminal domain-containing protein [Anderseniella sp.]